MQTTTNTFQKLPLGQLHANVQQPRRAFDDEEILQLSESIRNHGILQPLVVRATPQGYQIIAGERRFRAAQVAGLQEVPVHVVDFNDQQTLEAALVENIQRTDLNPIEKAQGFKDYCDRFGISKEDLALRLGLDRSTVSSIVAILSLPQEVQDAVRLNQISTGHAKALRGLTSPEDQVILCKETVLKGLSVKALEVAIRTYRADKEEAERLAAERAEKAAKAEQAKQAEQAELEKPREAEAFRTAHLDELEGRLMERFAARCQIKLRAREKGTIVFHFESNDEFERLMDRLR